MIFCCRSLTATLILLTRVGALLDQVAQHAHALVHGLLQSSHLVGKGLHLGLELDDFLAHAKGRMQAGHEQDGDWTSPGELFVELA